MVLKDRHAGQDINTWGCWIDVEASNTWGCAKRRRVPTSTIFIQISPEHADAEGSIGDVQGGIGRHLNAWGHENIQGVSTCPQV